MGVYIKGMEMPTNCGDCYFEQIGAEEDDGDTCISYCLLTEWRIPLSNRDDMKLPSCPLIEVDNELMSKFAEVYLEREAEDGNIHT